MEVNKIEEAKVCINCKHCEQGENCSFCSNTKQKNKSYKEYVYYSYTCNLFEKGISKSREKFMKTQDNLKWK